MDSIALFTHAKIPMLASYNFSFTQFAFDYVSIFPRYCETTNIYRVSRKYTASILRSYTSSLNVYNSRWLTPKFPALLFSVKACSAI